jgi:hypothetical protein
MIDSERTCVVAFDWTLALLIAAVTGWCALRVGIPVLAGMAALTGFALGLWAMGWAGKQPRRFALPAFEVPGWPEQAEPEVLPPGVIRLPVRRLPTPGELERRVRAHLDRQAAPSAEVVELKSDASAALRQALAGLKPARSN